MAGTRAGITKLVAGELAAGFVAEVLSESGAFFVERELFADLPLRRLDAADQAREGRVLAVE